MTTAAATQIADLKAEVERLQRKLGDVHDGDYNALARAYRSLVQHIQALQMEAQMMKKHIDALDVEVMNPDEVCSELGAVGVVTAVAVAANRMFKGRNLAALRLSIYAGGAIYLGIRFTAAGIGRLGSLLRSNRQRKRRLQQDWDALVERIRIMDSVSRWEGQDPSLAPQHRERSSPAASEGAVSSGWVDVAAGEAEGNVSYPKPYTAAAAKRSESEEGLVAYPQVHQGAHQAGTEEDGVVTYPSASAGTAELPRPGNKKGSGQAHEMPSAPPLPAWQAGQAASERHRQAVAQEVPSYHGR
mmetsp:Transcript_13238/g.40097  ORF Transcript_13238/g.40097 Transcript_13238/m.40097 type:complete len:301 (+) Transcript_13238:224-1126(+)